MSQKNKNNKSKCGNGIMYILQKCSKKRVERRIRGNILGAAPGQNSPWGACELSGLSEDRASGLHL